MSESKQDTAFGNAAVETSNSRRKFLKGGLAAAAGVTTGILGAPAVVTAAAPKVIQIGSASCRERV